MSKVALFNPKFVSYSKASQKSAHANGVYKVFPKNYDAATSKYSTSTVELTEENLQKGYVFFPGSRIAFFTVNNWWNANIKSKPLIQVAVEAITSAMDVMERLTYGNGYSPEYHSALVHPNYAEGFANAVRNAYPNNNAAVESILRFFPNLQQSIDNFRAYDRIILDNAKNFEAKRLSHKEALNLLTRIHGITKKQTSIEGKPLDKPPKAVSATKLNYTKEDLLAESKAGYWFDISGTEIKEAGKIKGVSKSQVHPQPDRHYFYTNPELPINLYYPIKATPADTAAVQTRVANFMRVRNIPFVADNWKIGTYQYQFEQSAKGPVTQVNTGMINPLSNRPVTAVAQQPIFPATGNVQPAPLTQLPAFQANQSVQPTFQPVQPAFQPVQSSFPAQPSIDTSNF